MQAIRETLDVLDGSITLHLPASFAARRVEVIVLPADDTRIASAQRPHRPAPELAGTVIHDDLIAPAVTSEDWDALR